MKLKTSFVGEHTTYLTLTERVSTFVVILPNENKIKFMITARSIHSSGRHFQVLCEIFSLPQRLSNHRREKIQLNAMHWTLLSNVTIGSLWFLPIQKFHFLLGWVGKLCAETNFNFPAPPVNQIFGMCKSLADTWPAATRVLFSGSWERSWLSARFCWCYTARAQRLQKETCRQ